MKNYMNSIDEVINNEILSLGIKDNSALRVLLKRVINTVKERQHLVSAEAVYDLHEECNGLDWEIMQTLKRPEIK